MTIAFTSSAIAVPHAAGPFKLILPVPEPPDLDAPEAELGRLASELYPHHLSRFTSEGQTQLEQFAAKSHTRAEFEATVAPDDYVALFVADLIELSHDPGRFLADRKIEADESKRLLDALHELSKPALIVDGQHRVFGAADARSGDVSFLVCAMPSSSWRDQAFQFVVINEEARPVDATVLYDIFGSSLTRVEATDVRRRLGTAGKDVEKKIAAVVAYRDEDSPFFNMVELRVNDLPKSVKPFLSPRVIVDLIDGSRLCRAFRDDAEFLQWVVKPTLEEGETVMSWTAWHDGKWRDYWYAFWSAVRDYFNAKSPGLWDPKKQSNLTKGVALKTLQDLILDRMISNARKAASMANEMRNLGVEESIVQRLVEGTHIPPTAEAFYKRVKDEHLGGFPAKFYVRDWVKSLETAAGAEALKTVLSETFSSYVETGGSKKYPYWKNAQVFAPGKSEE